MKITLYTITDCAFSKQEKEYLSAHGLQFEEKNLETNREFLTEMLAIGGNFAGTPVTKIEKDDGQIIVLKGFTTAEFDKTLALTPTQTVEPVQTQPVAVPVAEVTPVAAPVEQPVVAQAPAPVVLPVESVPVAPAPVAADPAMASVLNTLEQQTQVADTSPEPVQVVPAPVAPMPGAPVIPDPQF